MIAIAKFDPQYGVRFLTYAAPWVRVKMDEVQHRLGTVHVSVHQRKRSMQLGEGAPEAIMTPVDDVQLADSTDVEREATPEGRVALSFLHAAGLTRCEKLVLVLSLGAVTLLNVLIRSGSAVNVASLFYLVPPATALFAWALFGETLSGWALAGMGLAAAGVWLARQTR